MPTNRQNRQIHDIDIRVSNDDAYTNLRADNCRYVPNTNKLENDGDGFGDTGDQPLDD
jgi:hypothetical protein